MPLPPSQLKPPRKSLIFRLHPAVGVNLALFALGASLAFGLIGLSVARGQEAFHGYAWVPRLLVIASGGLILTTAARILRRRISRKLRRPLLSPPGV
ncbi:MAG: hypothetical protein MUD16_03665 [Desulfobacterales bacterium]|jgi:hypothetical protein|nr:hypothetical protein [Desulfobacterales bacterium]